eukprot:CAMPEP_0176178438 /NCGR_PEP_ID=MMETSP0120_2-20121206/91430_1 /TAXON_ID=160619 /ORGANISM="Kryptoperidinium foliaceum, Strain CCMP 1326" /LENGTH=80 /DNA_ID=CAMNT_0017516593 /DNA_START=30 /DNA_END=268 /DNA_ORIENTATION=+
MSAAKSSPPSCAEAAAWKAESERTNERPRTSTKTPFNFDGADDVAISSAVAAVRPLSHADFSQALWIKSANLATDCDDTA